jgi:hypothetical protein
MQNEVIYLWSCHVFLPSHALWADLFNVLSFARIELALTYEFFEEHLWIVCFISLSALSRKLQKALPDPSSLCECAEAMK